MANVLTKPSDAYSSFDVRVGENSDTFSYTAAHPDHTLVLAGPPRFTENANSTPGKVDNLFVLGSLQSFMMSSAKPWQPYQPIGQVATTFLGAKTQNQAQVSRLLANGPNLLKALYSGMGDIQGYNDESTLKYFADDDTSNFWINLDNPLFHVPIGLAILFRNKNMTGIGGVYLELCVIQSVQTQVQMGQAMILENTGLIFDRAVPLSFGKNPTPLPGDTANAGITGA